MLLNLLHFYGNVISKADSNQSSNNKSSDDSGSEILEAKNGVENVGTAVFRQDKLVGTLTPLETVAHLIVTGRLRAVIFQCQTLKTRKI